MTETTRNDLRRAVDQITTLMIPFDTLVELLTIATEPWGYSGWYHVAPPTKSSVAKIQDALGILIPEDYIRIATACPCYGGWLAGIGDDYEHRCHILTSNHILHNPSDEPDNFAHPLPAHMVMLNHGHDGDCDCWDVREATASGEHPIVYLCLESDILEPIGDRFDDFRAYIEKFAVQHAPRAGKTRRRRRAKRLIQQLQPKPGDGQIR